MKNIRAFFCIVLMALAFSNPGMSQAQTTDTLKQIQGSDTSQEAPIVNNANEPDEGMDIFLLIYGTIMVCIMAGAVAMGAFAATLILLFLAGLVTAGILSVSVVAGLYRRSFAAGFKTLLIIVCSGAGIVLGSVSFLAVARIFNISADNTKALIAGMLGGCIGGIFLALLLFKMIRMLADRFKQQIKL